MSEQGGKLERQVILVYGAEIASTVMTRTQVGKFTSYLLRNWELVDYNRMGIKHELSSMSS